MQPGGFHNACQGIFSSQFAQKYFLQEPLRFLSKRAARKEYRSDGENHRHHCRRGHPRPGRGLSASWRLSGPEAVSAASAAFRAADSRPLEAHPPRRLIYGDLLDREGAVIDKVLATYTRGPGLLHR